MAKVVGERDFGLERPFVAAGDAAAQEGGAAELVLLLPAEHAPGVVAFGTANHRGGQAVLVVGGGSAVGRARWRGAGEVRRDIRLVKKGTDHFASNS